METEDDRYLEKHSDEAGEWEEGVQRRPGRVGSIVFSVRFARNEIAEIRRAASQTGERTSEFIRLAALGRVRGNVGTSIDLVPSTSAPPGGVIVFARAGPTTQVALRSDYVEVA